MTLELQVREKTSTRREVSTLLVSMFVSGLAIPFYIEATKNASSQERASSIATNAVVSFYVTKASLDYLADLVKNGESRKAVAVSVTAALLYAPEVLISVLESTFSKDFTIFAAVATGLSGSFLAAYSVGKVPGLAYSLKQKITQEAPSDIKKNVMTNLSQLMKLVRVADLGEVKKFEFNSTEGLLSLAMSLAQKAKEPCLKNTVLFDVIKPVMQLAAMVSMVYANIGYTCATEESARKDFGLAGYPVLAMVLANALLLFQYLMAVLGGASLVSSICNNLSVLNYGRFISNENNLGGLPGKLFSLSSPLLGALAASYSGAPSKQFCTSCDSSKMNGVLTFPHFEVAVDYAARAFNSAYTIMAFAWMARYAVERLGSDRDQGYLSMLAALDDLREQVKGMTNEEVVNTFGVRSDDSDLSSNAETASSLDTFLPPRVNVIDPEVSSVDRRASQDDLSGDEESVGDGRVVGVTIVPAYLPQVKLSDLAAGSEAFSQKFFSIKQSEADSALRAPLEKGLLDH